MKKAIFLDRDGVINHDIGYTHKIEDFHFVDGVFEALESFLHQGYLLFIVTNQSGIGRGYYTQHDFNKLTLWMNEEFLRKGIVITKVLCCPHGPDEQCSCRKPSAGMINELVNEFNINVKNSWMIGDNERDIEAGINAGVFQTILVSEKQDVITQAKYQSKNLRECQFIIK